MVSGPVCNTSVSVLILNWISLFLFVIEHFQCFHNGTLLMEFPTVVFRFTVRCEFIHPDLDFQSSRIWPQSDPIDLKIEYQNRIKRVLELQKNFWPIWSFEFHFLGLWNSKSGWINSHRTVVYRCNSTKGTFLCIPSLTVFQLNDFPSFTFLNYFQRASIPCTCH